MTPNPASLETPALLVDLAIMEGNIARAAAYAAEHGLALRPHVKTHKSPVIAARQVAAGACGLTCATPFEAEVMSTVTDDILVAFPPVGARAARLARLPNHVRLITALDSAQALDAISSAAASASRTVGVYVELDLGMHRVGLPVVATAIELARKAAASRHLEFAGLAFYPGHVREAVADQSDKLTALNESLRDALQQFSEAGVEVRVVSGGSTPTLWRSHEIAGVTEIRPGTYVYNDRTTAATGACDIEDCALTVLATVVSTAVPGQAVVDAGTKALGREPMRGSDSEGFGELLEHPGVLVIRMSEEHGILDLTTTDWRPVVGEQVRIIPNHVCIVVHLNDVVHGVRDGVIAETWRVAARGRGEPASVQG